MDPHPRSDAAADTLVERLAHWARVKPGAPAFSFLPDGEAVKATITFGELDAAARRVMAWLLRHTAPDARILLVQPASLQYVVSVLGCLYAGRSVVPTHPPRPGRDDERIRTIVEECGAAVALASAASSKPSAGDAWHLLHGVHSIAVEEVLSHGPSPDAEVRVPRPETVALVQYTSGSTSTPKGVVVTHATLSATERMIQRCFEVSSDSVIVGWLPLQHDMGLIGNTLQPVYAGCHCLFMPPSAFIQRPRRWLEALARYGGTISGGPNFAYDQCVDRIPPEERVGLDLSRWSVAFNGSEPVRADTLARFVDAFAPAGFRAEAFRPCYGLAEATLLVSGSHPRGAPVTCSVNTEALERQRIVLSSAPERSRVLVSCGTPDPEETVLVVDPARRVPVAADEIGEIWVSGPNVAQGFWGRAAASRRTFCARLRDRRGPFLRTGDLGFVRDGDVFITGRMKDLIIIRGQNHYAHDIERTAARAHEATRGLTAAAFGVETPAGEELAVVQEVRRDISAAVAADVCHAIRQAVTERHGLSPAQIGLVLPGQLPKTTSGKLQRSKCQALFVRGDLSFVTHDRLSAEPGEPVHSEVSEPVARDASARDASATLASVERIVRRAVAKGMAVPPARIRPDRPLWAYGFDSLRAVMLKSDIESNCGVTLPPDLLTGGITVRQLAQALVGLQPVRTPVTPSTAPSATSFPLSVGQRAIWYMSQLDPAHRAYNVPLVMRIRQRVDCSALRRALDEVVRLHPMLRCTVEQGADGPVQTVQTTTPDSVSIVDAAGSTDAQVRAAIRDAVARPFVPGDPSFLRVVLITRTPDDHVLVLCAHHLIVDFWSLCLVARDLAAALAPSGGGEPAKPRRAYADYVVWQTELLASAQSERLRAYWEQRLGGITALDLTDGKPRDPARAHDGVGVPFRLGTGTTARLVRLARDRHVTLHTVVLAAVQALLYRHTGQSDVVVGCPALGRTRAEWLDVVGYFVNPVAVRTSVEGGLSFAELLTRVHDAVDGALQHQDLPFASVVDRLHPERRHDAAPILQATFTFLRAPSNELAPLELFALGQSGATIRAGGLELESIDVDFDSAQADLSVTVAHHAGDLRGDMRFSAAAFDEEAARALTARFVALLESVATAPAKTIAELRLLRDGDTAAVARGPRQPPALLEEDVLATFERMAIASPTSIAVVDSDREITYGELDAMRHRIASALRARGLECGARVGVCMRRSVELVAAYLGTLTAGVAYVPLDPTYPTARLRDMVDLGRMALVLGDRATLDHPGVSAATIIDAGALASEPHGEAPSAAWQPLPEDTAYVIFTSGSTGKPKGVEVTRRNLLNVFRAMDARVGVRPDDTMLAGTSIGFDISVLELLWPLTHGARVVLLPDGLFSGEPAARRAMTRTVGFSLFYFANADAGRDKYRLLLDGARYADAHGFEAVWTPERHFHPFGGVYPNPAVTSAALATITTHVGIRGGSVVMPLHDPLRVAEEWAVVDNLSGGRVGIAFASGWHADDFALAPQNYAGRKEVTSSGVEAVRALWRGGTLRRTGGHGRDVELRIFPTPVQTELPVWLTAAGNVATFREAGRLGANVLTHLLGQSLDELAAKIRAYRDSLAQHGFAPSSRRVTLMLHTLVGESRDRVRAAVREPFTAYLRSSVDLMANLARTLEVPVDVHLLSERDMAALLDFAFERYFEGNALFGTPQGLMPMVERLAEIGVDEIGSLIDFGVPVTEALAGLESLDRLKALASSSSAPAPTMTLADYVERYRPTLFQCTPSVLRMLATQANGLETLQRLRTLLVGGDALPDDLAARVCRAAGCRIVNLYGPTETTVWSTAADVSDAGPVTIGTPLLNTDVYVLDRDLNPRPGAASGELYIGGEGVASGYSGRPDLTAAAFVPDPFARRPGARMYRTGDYARVLPGGTLAFLGRRDHQVKVRGVRLELGEIETALLDHDAIAECVVVARGAAGDERTLVAYYVAGEELAPAQLRAWLKSRVSSQATPSIYVRLPQLPLTANGKVDRKALPEPSAGRGSGAPFQPATTEHEQLLASIWRRVLDRDGVGVHDNFFDLGGHSLLMVQVQSELERALGRDVPLISLLEHPTIRALATFLDAGEAPDPTRDRMLDRAERRRESLLQRREQRRMATEAMST